MRNQQEDLENAEQSLLDTISEINTTAAKAFDDTFQIVQCQFCKTSLLLYLERMMPPTCCLVEPDDPLESPY